MFSDIISVISERDKYLASLIESIDKMLLVDSFTVILKSRAIGERVVKNIILIEGITGTDEMNQKDKINLLERQDFFRDDVYRSFHTLRVFGNRAIHDELEGVFETSLIEGKVKVHTAYEDMTLYPKDKAVLENGLLTRKQIDDMDTYRWRDGLYCFKNLSFDDVLKQFEIYYDIRFVKENPQIANPKLNGKFRLIDGVDYALRVLQREVGFSFRRDDEANVIYLK